MCGIAGIVGPISKTGLIDKMTTLQSHRGPDGYGTFLGKNVSLGHRRLKIIDLSDNAKQPMTDASGRYTIVFNGEIYNYLELKKKIGYKKYMSASDTEVLLNTYIEYGEKCLDKLIGMFSFAIWDKQEETLFCARDRFGIKPFYYKTDKNQNFYFSSEIRPLLINQKRKVNEKILYDFLAKDYYDHSEYTFFENINKLEPGFLIKVKNGRIISKKKYWNFHDEVNNVIIPNNYKKRQSQLMDILNSSMKFHIRSDVPIGVAVSGGIDSALLLALINENIDDPSKIQSFTIDYIEEKYSERKYVREMMRDSAILDNYVTVSPNDFVENIGKDFINQEEPYAGLPISGYCRGFEMIRDKGFIVIMDGSGIDEGLAGYTRFLPAYWADLKSDNNYKKLDSEFKDFGIQNDEKKKYLHLIEEVISDQQVGRGQDLTKSVSTLSLEESFVQKYKDMTNHFDQPFNNYLKNIMYKDLRYTKLPRALRFRDKLSMSVGCELRPPFLDHRLLAYEFALPNEDLIKGSKQKRILRDSVGDLLPSNIKFTPKRQVQTPQREWFRNELKGWINSTLNDGNFWKRGWVNEKKGKEKLNEYFTGQLNNSFFIWQWINLELWANHYIDNNNI